MRKFLTWNQVVARMTRGDLPIGVGGYSDAAVFADGAKARHTTMVKLIRRGIVDRPVGTCCTNPFTLTTTEN